MDKMESMTSLLRVLSSRQDHDEQVKTWMKQVREMAYDAEDSIDVFRYRLGRRRQENRIIIDFLAYTVRLLRRLKARHDVATDLQKLKLRACHVSERRPRYFLESGGATSAPSSSDPPHSVRLGEVRPKRMGGDELPGWLMDAKQPQLQVGVVSPDDIAGAALAREIHHSLAIPGGHFRAHAMVTASKSHDTEELLRTMIRQLSFSGEMIPQVLGDLALHSDKTGVEQCLDNLGEVDLVTTIINYLQDKRYLVVLDDIPINSAWDCLKDALPDKRNGSRIIMITADEAVAGAWFSHNYHSVSEEGGLVGFKPQRDDLIERITKEGQDQYGEIAIVGFGGLGKTTLAMQVFESLKVTGSHFHAYAWIAVSQSYKVEVLLRSIIRQLSISVQQIQHVLQLSASNQDIEVDKRYLIVLDDTWEISAWDSFKAALPYNRNGSRIIVTTRNKTVAHTCCSHNSFCNHIHEGQPLSTRQKCDGLPLAIVTIAGALAAKPKKTPDEWRKLHDHLGIELETNDSLKNINRVLLLLSYNDLPYHLKPCFLYLSIFTEDYEIDRKRLVRRWIAEGLLNGRRGMSDEEVAEGYFNELIDRSLIQPSKIDVVGKVKTRRENFVTVLSEHSTMIPHNKVRRLAQQGESTIKDDLYLSQIRSLTTFGNVIPLHDYGKMRLLRVLDLEECRSLRHVHLKNIGKLFLLNFLSLRNSRCIKKLPGSIGGLSNLQFLDVRETDIQKLPRAVVKLQRLAYLRGSWFYGGLRLPKGIRKMKGLQSLGVITGTDAAVLREIGELTQLKKLSVVQIKIQAGK
ncbi:unnamed protein product [Musa acuminata subsp. malaccensis]|nr:unnamed protein product [Musa acuminata subsp. malaccensis]